jgi:dihydrofolate reductase
MGHPVVMGDDRDSLPERFRPLPGPKTSSSPKSRLACRRRGECGISSDARLLDRTPRVFVIGGGAIYANAPLATDLFLTEIDADIEETRSSRAGIVTRSGDIA